MVERKDPVLWGPEFSERGYACLAIARGRRTIEVGEKDNFPSRIADGKKTILGQLGLARRYPQLEEPWMDAVLFAFSKLPPENEGERNLRDFANSRTRDRRHKEGPALETLRAIGDDLRAVTSFIDETMGVLMSSREKGKGERALEKELAGLECKLAASKAGLEALQSKKGTEAACEEDEDSWNDVEEELDQEIVAESAETLELMVKEKGAKLRELAAKADADWNEKLALEESLLESYKEQLAEQIGEAAEFTKSMSATVRREAANVLMEARDAHSLINFCYGEMDPDAREAAFRKAVEAARKEPDGSQISMGMRLGREERSMLLRMVEDTNPAIASLAWEFAEWMLDGGKLDGEQMDFVEMRAKDADGEVAARVLSKRAKIWIAEACGGGSEGRVSALVKVLEGIWSGLELDEEQRELAFEFTEDCDAKVSAQAFLLALEFCRRDELMPGQVAALARRADRIEDADKRMGTMAALFDLVPAGSLEDAGAEMLLAMAMAGHKDEKFVERGVTSALKVIIDGNASPAQVEVFLEAVDSLKVEMITEKKPRIFECVRQAVRPEELTENAAKMLKVERLSQIILDTVQPGRASGVPARKSKPPQETKDCAQPQARNACGGKG